VAAAAVLYICYSRNTRRVICFSLFNFYLPFAFPLHHLLAIGFSCQCNDLQTLVAETLRPNKSLLAPICRPIAFCAADTSLWFSLIVL